MMKLPQQVAEQLYLQLIARSEIRMSSFARERSAHFPFEMQSNLSQPSACGNNCIIAFQIRHTLIEYKEVLCLKRDETERVSFKIIDKRNPVKPEESCQVIGIHDPGQI